MKLNRFLEKIMLIVLFFSISVICTKAQDKSAMMAQRLSWAGVKLVAGDTTIFIDPWISADIWDGEWKKPVVPVEVSTENRFVLITHLHNDHFDPEAIRKILGKTGRVLCLPKTCPTIAANGFNLREVNLWQPYLAGDFTVVPVAAADYSQEEQVSWIVIGGGKRIIHAGDTMWHNAFYQIGEVYGEFDAAFLPINGVRLLARKPYTDVPASLTPDQAVAAAQILRAKELVPIHYGMNDPSYYLEFPNVVETLVKTAKQQSVPLEIRDEGETISWKSNR